MKTALQKHRHALTAANQRRLVVRSIETARHKVIVCDPPKNALNAGSKRLLQRRIE
jgi:energy-coupling factor transporter ATP-binding protein EcfA2